MKREKHTITSLTSAFLRDERGNLAIIFGLLLLVLIGVISLAVDYGGSAKERTTTHQALRNATVYAAESYKYLLIRQKTGSQMVREGELFPNTSTTYDQAMEIVRDYVADHVKNNIGDDTNELCVARPQVVKNSRGEDILEVKIGIVQHRELAIGSGKASCDCSGAVPTGDGCSVVESGKIIFPQGVTTTENALFMVAYDVSYPSLQSGGQTRIQRTFDIVNKISAELNLTQPRIGFLPFHDGVPTLHPGGAGDNPTIADPNVGRDQCSYAPDSSYRSASSLTSKADTLANQNRIVPHVASFAALSIRTCPPQKTSWIRETPKTGECFTLHDFSETRSSPHNYPPDFCQEYYYNKSFADKADAFDTGGWSQSRPIAESCTCVRGGHVQSCRQCPTGGTDAQGNPITRPCNCTWSDYTTTCSGKYMKANDVRDIIYSRACAARNASGAPYTGKEIYQDLTQAPINIEDAANQHTQRLKVIAKYVGPEKGKIAPDGSVAQTEFVGELALSKTPGSMGDLNRSLVKSNTTDNSFPWTCAPSAQLANNDGGESTSSSCLTNLSENTQAKSYQVSFCNTPGAVDCKLPVGCYRYYLEPHLNEEIKDMPCAPYRDTPRAAGKDLNCRLGEEGAYGGPYAVSWPTEPRGNISVGAVNCKPCEFGAPKKSCPIYPAKTPLKEPELDYVRKVILKTDPMPGETVYIDDFAAETFRPDGNVQYTIMDNFDTGVPDGVQGKGKDILPVYKDELGHVDRVLKLTHEQNGQRIPIGWSSPGTVCGKTPNSDLGVGGEVHITPWNPLWCPQDKTGKYVLPIAPTTDFNAVMTAMQQNYNTWPALANAGMCEAVFRAASWVTIEAKDDERPILVAVLGCPVKDWSELSYEGAIRNWCPECNNGGQPGQLTKGLLTALNRPNVDLKSTLKQCVEGMKSKFKGTIVTVTTCADPADAAWISSLATDAGDRRRYIGDLHCTLADQSPEDCAADILQSLLSGKTLEVQ